MHPTAPTKMISCILSILLVFLLILSRPAVAAAAPASLAEAAQQMEERKELPIQTNAVENWPEGPAIGAEAAILMEANTGVILYAKNIHEKLYPASTTKLMTCLVASEHSKMDEPVTFSHDAVFGIGPGSSNIGIDPGQMMPMSECFYGILVASANEVAAAVAEHVGGTLENFVQMMNDQAADMGLKDTHFTNPHGLFSEDHYTSAYDLSIIAKAFFQNELLARMGNTPSHHFFATATQPDDFTIRNKHQLISGEIAYDGIKGGKTGYTDEARQTLVTCAEKNGMRLICVILKEESPEQFNDTVKLFDYGFNNFAVANIAEHETTYNVDESGFFHSSYAIFGNSKSILSLNENSYLILPKTVSFDSLTSKLSYDLAEEGEAARIQYYYRGAYLGTASVLLAGDEPASYAFNTELMKEGNRPAVADSTGKTIYINVRLILQGLLLFPILVTVIAIVIDVSRNYAFIGRPRRRPGRKRRKDRDLHF